MGNQRQIIPMSDGSRSITSDDISPTRLPDDFLESPYGQAGRSFRLPRFNDLPDIPLYRDQVIGVVEQALSSLDAGSDGPWLTASMVNNYVKSRMLPAPVKKQYSRDHLARLIVICIFKQVIPMAAIQRLLRMQEISYPVDIAYDYVASEVEQAVHTAFSDEALASPSLARSITRESLLVHSTALAFGAKAYVMTYLSFTGYEN